MALKATIIKAHVTLSDMDTHNYQDLSLTLAQHPSETEQRLMIRVLAYALNACENLEFTKGLCADDEPEIWHKNYSGEIELWIELGLPDEKRLKKALGRAKKVIVYAYGEGAQDIWWQKNAPKLNQQRNLSVISLPSQATQQLANMAKRNMQLNITVQDGDVWLSDEQSSLEIKPTVLL
ncbi:YaeQ family protein [Pseudoalteromonas ulvae]|uniref:YaeQ family protein n=1 Tax=Pseudoalteromonas ulvae TaxID=107327 RepID=A0A244CKW0_PSEDV|nr:YaeQ family protein [Pseudoalteromonas ulvae]OUL56004.1 hypothetical protein B1199_20080 [Pseudoalteromonas ulvae]